MPIEEAIITMNYELAKELKEAGFPARCSHTYCPDNEQHPYKGCDEVIEPSLSELIAECGESFEYLEYSKRGTEDSSNTHWLEKKGRWTAASSDDNGITTEDEQGHTPSEAVARLWLALNKKPV